MPNNFPIKEIAARFKEVIDRAPRELGIDAVNFFQDSFKEQAWRGATREPWPARKVSNWGKKVSAGRSVLIKSGRLKRSIRVTSSSSEQTVVGTDVPYARVHNEGFKGPVKQTVKPFTRRNGQQVKGFNRTINQNIPRRKYMGESPVLTAQLRHNLESKLLNSVPKS